MNGEWTTRTLDVNSVLQHYNQQDSEASAKVLDIEKSPIYGLLSQTVIRSPKSHWILPVKLRGPDTNDVAFIGVSGNFLSFLFSVLEVIRCMLLLRSYTLIVAQSIFEMLLCATYMFEPARLTS